MNRGGTKEDLIGVTTVNDHQPPGHVFKEYQFYNVRRICFPTFQRIIGIYSRDLTLYYIRYDANDVAFLMPSLP